MPVSDQGVNLERYMLIPRTAIFVRRGDSYLLLKGAPTKRLWAGKFNGLGGHTACRQDQNQNETCQPGFVFHCVLLIQMRKAGANSLPLILLQYIEEVC